MYNKEWRLHVKDYEKKVFDYKNTSDHKTKQTIKSIDREDKMWRRLWKDYDWFRKYEINYPYSDHASESIYLRNKDYDPYKDPKFITWDWTTIKKFEDGED